MNFVKKYSLVLVFVLGVACVLCATYYEGIATERWGQKFDQSLKSFKDAIENAIPTQVGSWIADASEDQIGIENELVRRVAGAEGSIGRHYRGSFDQPDVHINITCGPSRSVGAHTPDVCFTGSGSNQETDVELFDVLYEVLIPDPENPSDPGKVRREEHAAHFKTAIFSDAASHYQQRVFWGWKGATTDWVAPRFPRLKWNSSEPICKMYVSILEDSGLSGKSADSLKTADDFLKCFLPTLVPILDGEFVLPESMRVVRGRKSTEGTADASPTDVTDEAQKKPEDELELSIPEPKTEPVAESTAEPVAEPKTEPTVEAVAEPAESKSEEPVQEEAPKAKEEPNDEFTL